MTKYVVEWVNTRRGTEKIEAESEEDARSIFWDWYVNGIENLLEDRSDWDIEIYPT